MPMTWKHKGVGQNLTMEDSDEIAEAAVVDEALVKIHVEVLERFRVGHPLDPDGKTYRAGARFIARINTRNAGVIFVPGDNGNQFAVNMSPPAGEERPPLAVIGYSWVVNTGRGCQHEPQGQGPRTGCV